MGKFKVGDRVRLKEDYTTWDAGTEGVVTGVSPGWDWEGENTEDLIYTDTVSGVYARRLELVPAWQPKVGERVRFVRDNTDGGATYGAKGEAATVAYVYNERRVKIEFDEGRQPISTFKPGAAVSDIEPAPAAPAEPPTPLTITTGKFYKTRDGRKVGPIVVAQGPDDPWPWKLASGTHYYRNDGFSCPGWADGHRHKDDLIAEWVDKPATIANDNAAPAKFKVGDVVKFRDDYELEKVRGVKATVVRVNEWGVQVKAGKGFGLSTERPDSIELVTTTPAIVALIENGVALPSTRPVVHASQEAATAEAGRLALLNPGQEFGVFVLADSKIADIVEEVVKKTVLRAA
ncbi:hypothetical protein HLI01_09040 [Rhizobium laguerreae]|uniref:hypothetical protein n=1 Tax=Rhizobium laguerreae TaxID=1076926 RepID=UPI00147969E6|nr:hypothetical protein [Rhizobium laguerreae]NNH56952.1 hypothetical protein [Rhizobium laguerreae]